MVGIHRRYPSPAGEPTPPKKINANSYQVYIYMLPSIYLYLEVDKHAFVGSIARLRVVVVAGNFLADSVRRVHDAPVDGKAGRVVAGELLSKSTHTARTKQKAYDPCMMYR